MHSSLFRLFVFSLLLMGLSATLPRTSWAQDEDAHAPEPETWALQFAINPNLDVASFSGSTLSIKRQFSSTRALRLGLSIDASFEDTDQEGESQRSFDERDSQSYSLEGVYMVYFAGNNDIHAYTGAGPFVWTGSVNSELVLGDRRRDRSQDMWGVGVVGVLGVEWFVRSNLSLTAEYGLDVSFSRDTQDEVNTEGPTTEEEEVTTDRFSFGGRGAKFGVSLYF